ncbi:MAG: TrmH family RNA methyltransferase [Pseudomonadota bacterium]
MRLVLYQPEIAQNAGAATRAAACFDAGLDIIEPCGFPLNAKTFSRVAMDYGLLAQPRFHRSWRAFETHRQKENARLILITTKANQKMTDFSFNKEDWIIVGQESAGVPDSVRNSANASVRIEMSSKARSLNVSVAAAIALSEMRRQCGFDEG